MKKNYTRKDFLGKITAATLSSIGAGALLPTVAGAESASSKTDLSAEIPEGATILFQGDSITDAGRNREDTTPNSQGGLGTGYAFLAASHLRHVMAAHNLQCYNRGISGNKVFQLADRWNEDCLQLKPDILSILIGVNDFWHTLNGYDGTVEVYENDFRALLKRTRDALPDVKLVIGEPFVITEGSAIVKEKWFPEFRKYQRVARQIAKDTGAAFIPYQSVFDEASKEVPSVYWAADGVHPTTAGCHLMAHAWLETVKRL